MRVNPSDSRKVIWAAVMRVGGGGNVGGKVRKTKVVGWRVVVREARRWDREVEPGAGAVDVIWYCCLYWPVSVVAIARFDAAFLNNH